MPSFLEPRLVPLEGKRIDADDDNRDLLVMRFSRKDGTYESEVTGTEGAHLLNLLSRVKSGLKGRYDFASECRHG